MNNKNLTIEYVQLVDAEEINSVFKKSWLSGMGNKDLGIDESVLEKEFEWNDDAKKAFEESFTKKNLPGEGYWKAVENSKILGIIRAGKSSDKKAGQIKSIYVLPEAQGKGIAQKLMETALNWLSDQDEVQIQCAAYNIRAQKFYEKFGFKVDENGNIEPRKTKAGVKIPLHLLVKKNSLEKVLR